MNNLNLNGYEKQLLEDIIKNTDRENVPIGFLSDKDIKYCLDNQIMAILALDDMFDPEEQIQGCSIDLRLGAYPRKINECEPSILEVGKKEDEEIYTDVLRASNGYIEIAPYEVILVNTVERVFLPADFIGILHGRSSIARLGLLVHCCQTLIVPGHLQYIPLQLINLSKNTLRVKINTRVCQLTIIRMENESEHPYYNKVGAKYQNEGPQSWGSRTSEDKEYSKR